MSAKRSERNAGAAETSAAHPSKNKATTPVVLFVSKFKSRLNETHPVRLAVADQYAAVGSDKNSVRPAEAAAQRISGGSIPAFTCACDQFEHPGFCGSPTDAV